MTTITINLDDTVLAHHLELSLASAIPLEEHLNAFLAAPETEAEQAEVADGVIAWLDAVEMGVTRMSSWQHDKRFILQDLFEDSEWARVQSPRWVGRRFGERVEGAGLANRVGTTTTNKAIYLRVQQ